MPVIISKESALADYIEKNNLGITISSLYDIEASLKSLSDAEVQLIRKSVMVMSNKLRNGEMLGALLEKYKK